MVFRQNVDAEKDPACGLQVTLTGIPEDLQCKGLRALQTGTSTEGRAWGVGPRRFGIAHWGFLVGLTRLA